MQFVIEAVAEKEWRIRKEEGASPYVYQNPWLLGRYTVDFRVVGLVKLRVNQPHGNLLTP